MKQERISTTVVKIMAEDGCLLRRRGETATAGNTALIAAAAVADWEEITVEEAENAKRSAEAEERYRHIVNERIRRRYDVNDELAILRQRDTKPEEFAAYNAFAESCKADAKILLVREKAEREAEFAAAQKAAQSDGEPEAQAD